MSDPILEMVTWQGILRHGSLEMNVKAMTHQPTQLLSWVRSRPVGVCVIGLQLDLLLHSRLVSDRLVGSGPPYDSTVELGWVISPDLYMYW